MVNGKGPVKEFLKDAALGAIAAASVDGFIEISRLPVLNDPIPSSLQFAGTEQLSNAEAAIALPALVAFVIGMVDIVGGKSLIPGYGKTLAAYGGGALLGLGFYENNVAKWIGIRDTT